MVGKLIALVLPLGLDTFAVAAALGAIGVKQRLRTSVVLCSFEAGMPLIGLALGAPLGRAIGGTADFVAIGVLLAFGLYTLASSEVAEEERLAQFASLRGPAALLLGVSVSLDELAIGFTLGLLQLPVVLVVALIAGQAFVLAQLGLRLGGRLSEWMREGAARLAGVVLTGLAVALLVQKLV